MSERETYSYTVLRYVHDVMTAEFVNVGIVLHATSGLKSKFRSTYGRVSSVFPTLDEKAFKETLRAVRTGIEHLAKSQRSAGLFQSSPDAMAFARKALAIDDSSFQWSPPGSGVTRDPAATLDQLYSRFVTRHERHAVHRRDDADVWKPIREKLEELDIADRFQEHTFRGSVEEITLEHTWKNGKWHAIEAISLDLADAAEVKKKAHRIRGHLDSAADGLIDEVALNLVLGPPSNPDVVDAYNAARKILENAAFRPTIVDVDSSDALIARLADEIRVHESPFRN
jgi:Protein of unknown function (DUF3037)